jgi:hypothetical protein
VTTRGSISSAMTRFFGRADLFRLKGRSWQGFFRTSMVRTTCSQMISRPSFLWGFGTPPSCVTQTHTRFFDDFVFASNWVFRARNVCSFETGLRSLGLSFSGQQCLQVIRGWASVPRIVFFRSAVPSSYSRLAFGPSNCLFWVSSAFKLFEDGLRSLKLSFTAQQCLQSVRA